jgi:hypothetical protein
MTVVARQQHSGPTPTGWTSSTGKYDEDLSHGSAPAKGQATCRHNLDNGGLMMYLTCSRSASQYRQFIFRLASSEFIKYKVYPKV